MQDVMDNQIEDNRNAWRYPVLTFAPNETGLKQQILQHKRIREIRVDIDVWKKHCSTVDEVLKPLLDGIKRYAKEQFDGLIIHDYVRQGSSREGLKVKDALEFDCLLKFEIYGMRVRKCTVFDRNGDELLDLVKLHVEDAEHLIIRYPWINRLGIFQRGLYYGQYYINTKNLHEKVFKSLIDRTRAIIDKQLAENNQNMYPMRHVSSPPTCAIRITVDKDISYLRDVYQSVILESLAQGEAVRRTTPTLDIDIVPSLLLRRDSVPDPYTVRRKFGERNMECPVYAVMKWVHKTRERIITEDHEKLWRESCCTYEKHILDIARRNPSQRYLMTACRIVKSYVTWLKIHRPDTNQLHRVAVSYYLKNICFHCIALLTIPSNNNKLVGVKEALGYFLQLFELCIQNRNLPHFFYGNPWVSAMFPSCSFVHVEGQKNLYSLIASDTFVQAERGFREMLRDLSGLYTDFTLLEFDRIGPFKELLGLSHEYEKPKPEPSRLLTCRFVTYVSILFAILAIALSFIYNSYII